MDGPWSGVGVVETYTGEQFDLFDPDPDAVHLRDIAAGLAHTCRFGGHCRHFYSVAHHALLVSREIDGTAPRTQLLALLHDAGEAYVGDVPRPLKRQLEDIERLEDEILAAVWRALAVDPPTDDEWERVMAADDRLLAYEADALLSDASWAADPPALEYDVEPRPTEEVREQFLSRSRTLLDRVGSEQ
jgi:hypothetical protein